MKKTTAAEVIPATPGTPFGGGLSCIRMFDGIEPYLLVVATNEGDFANLTHKQALGAIKKLTLGGAKDWKLPNRAEALAMFEHLRGTVADTDDAFGREYYWTDQQYASGPSYAWFQSFARGDQGDFHESSQLRARAVRRVKI